MFFESREEVMERLEALRDSLCCCMPSSRCDCKYGFEWAGYEPAKPKRSEQTCCPELRCAIAVLNRMTDEEYKALIYFREAPAPFKDAGAGI